MTGTYTGMIAQDVEKVSLEWISEDRNGCKQLTVVGFEGRTVEALRDLRAEKGGQIERLRREKDAQIAAQQAVIDELLRRVVALEQSRSR